MNVGLTVNTDSEAEERRATQALVDGLTAIDVEVSLSDGPDLRSRGVIADLLITGLAPTAVYQVARLIREIVRRDRVEITATSDEGKEFRISARPEDLPSTQEIVQAIMGGESTESDGAAEEE